MNMLSEKKTKKPALSVVKKISVKVIKMKQELSVPVMRKSGSPLTPPADEFNTEYIKSKKHDPL